MRVLLVIMTFLSLNVVHALEIDEKLTLRFLKVSNSKKTILINRGAEDGLVVGDHAKFFVTSGIIARGVLEKASPSRSVWSLYRIVDPAEITDGKVLNLKIASPVKITEDPTKSTKDEPIPAGSEKMSLTDGSSDTMNEADQKEMEGLGLDDKVPAKKETPAKSNKSKELKEVSTVEETSVRAGSNIFKVWELWGSVYVNSISGTVSSSNSSSVGSTAATASTVDLSAGIERYFFNTESFLNDMSVSIFINKRSIEVGQEDIQIASDWVEFGGGASYHFSNSPASTNRFIGFGTVNFGVGSSTLKETFVSNGISTETPIKGTNTFLAGGLGAKYILNNGFGIRGVLDYYSASESYNYPNSEVKKRALAGPRIEFGISYRF